MDKIRISKAGQIFEFGVLPGRPNPLTNPQREYVYDGAGKIMRVVERISLDCWFVAEPTEIWNEFDAIKEHLEYGLMDFYYIRDTTTVLELKRSDHVASPRFENIIPTGTPGTLANHIHFRIDVVAERGTVKGEGYGAPVIDVNRATDLIQEDGPGGTREEKVATVRGHKEAALTIIDAYILAPEETTEDELQSIKYTHEPDQNRWTGRAVYGKKTTNQPGGGSVETWTETISVSGGGQVLNFFPRTAGLLPLEMYGKIRPFVIVVTGEMEGPLIQGLKIPSRPGMGATALSGPRSKTRNSSTSKEKLRKLGKSGATEFDIAVSRTHPDGSPRTFRLRYKEIYKRALYEEQIIPTIGADYLLATILDIAKGTPVFPSSLVGPKGRFLNPWR